MSNLAPIAFFAYKRPFVALQSLFSLSRCPEAARSRLFIFSDAARSPADEEGVRLTREVIRLHRWCGEVEIIESPANRGAPRSVIDGVTRLCSSDGKVIVVEDDLLVSSGFLSYMNEALDRYESSPRAMAIAGHMFDIANLQDRAVFLPGCSSWGWATWARAWAKFQESPTGLEQLTDSRVRRAFNEDDSYPFAEMLERKLATRVLCWDILWRWAIFQNDGLSLYPARTLVRNIGTGEDATHTAFASGMAGRDWTPGNRVTSFPSAVEIDQSALAALRDGLRSTLGTHRQRAWNAFWSVSALRTPPGERRRQAKALLAAIRGE